MLARASRSVLVLLLLALPALAEAPSVTGSDPADGARDVPLDVGALVIRFDRDMDRGSWTLWNSDRGELPPLAGALSNPWLDARTFRLPLGPLAPGKTYAIQLNAAASGRQGFRAADGSPLPDTSIAFRTRNAAGPGTRAPAPAALEFDLGPAQPDPERLWTVLVYLAADNDVEGYAPETLDDIEARFPATGVEVIVLFDRAEGFGTSHGDWKNTRVYRVRRGADTARFESQQIADLGEVNMGDPATLAGFLAAGLRTFPAKRVALLMWDHGVGWGGSAIDIGIPGAEGGSDQLSLPELRQGIEQGLAAAGAKRLDLVWFHMCLMAQIEVAAELAGTADFMVASEAMIPCAVVPYGDLVASLAETADPRAAASGMVGIYRRAYEAKGFPRATSSAVDLTRLPGLLDALDALAAKLGAAAAEHWPTMARSLFFSENYLGRTDYRQGERATMSIDLGDALKRLRANLPVFPDAECDRLEEEFERCLLANYVGPRWRLSHGLAVYGPMRGDLMNAAYRETVFAKRGGWLGFLERVHRALERERTPPQIADARVVDARGRPTEIVEGLSGTRVEFTVEGRNLLWVLAQQVKRLREPEGLAVMFRTFVADPRYERRKAETASELVDLLMPEYADGKNPMAAEVGGLAFRVTDGKTVAEATIDYSDPSDVQHARVPAIYSHPSEGRCRADILFDVNWSAAAAVIGYVPTPDGGVVPKLLRPNPEAEITLLYEVVTPENEVVFVPTSTLVWGSGLTLLPVFEDPGNYGLLILAESLEGLGASRMVQYEQKGNPAFDQLAREGGRFGPRELLGEWKLENGRLDEAGGQVVFEDTGIRVKYWPDPAQPGNLRYEFRSERADDLPAGIVLVDTRAAPCLIYFVDAGGGQWTRSEFHIAFHTPGGGVDAFLLKDVFTGGVYRLIREGGGPTPPPPAGGLDGRWVTEDGQYLLILSGNQYQSYMGGMLMDQGVFQVQGDRIVSRNAMGVTQQIGFTLSGNSLTLAYENGMTVRLVRAR